MREAKVRSNGTRLSFADTNTFFFARVSA